MFKIHKFRSFKMKNFSSFLPNDLFSYVKTSFKKGFCWFASWNSIQRRSGYNSMVSIKSIKNLIRSQIFQRHSLKVLFFLLKSFRDNVVFLGASSVLLYEEGLKISLKGFCFASILRNMFKFWMRTCVFRICL